MNLEAASTQPTWLVPPALRAITPRDHVDDCVGAQSARQFFDDGCFPRSADAEVADTDTPRSRRQRLVGPEAMTQFGSTAIESAKADESIRPGRVFHRIQRPGSRRAQVNDGGSRDVQNLVHGG